MVSCEKCALFIPDKVGDGSGIDRCKAFEDYKAMGASPAAMDKAFKSLGDKVFWRGTLPPEQDTGDRICKKFVDKNN